MQRHVLNDMQTLCTAERVGPQDKSRPSASKFKHTLHGIEGSLKAGAGSVGYMQSKSNAGSKNIRSTYVAHSFKFSSQICSPCRGPSTLFYFASQKTKFSSPVPRLRVHRDSDATVAKYQIAPTTAPEAPLPLPWPFAMTHPGSFQ
jgi:hypothetical protein